MSAPLDKRIGIRSGLEKPAFIKMVSPTKKTSYYRIGKKINYNYIFINLIIFWNNVHWNRINILGNLNLVVNF